MATDRRILVIEDDTEIRDGIAGILEMEGYRIQSAAHGREALELLSTGPLPALIILDLMLPIMSGCEVLKHLKSAAATAAIPVIVASAVHAPALDGLRADFVIRKPFDLDTLLMAIKTLWGDQNLK
jgi:CheY-like chemotaxis protein